MALAAGKVFVGLHDAVMIVKVDIVNHTYKTVMTHVQPFNMNGYGSLLYVVDFGGIRVIDATRL